MRFNIDMQVTTQTHFHYSNVSIFILLLSKG